MKKLILTLALAAGFSGSLLAGTPATPTFTPDATQRYIYEVNRSQAIIYKFDANTMALVDQVYMQYKPNNPVTDFYGLTRLQTTGEWFAIAEFNNQPNGTDRALVKVNMATGYVELRGYMTERVATLTSDASGQLWVVLGNNANYPNTVCKMDPWGGITPYLDRGTDLNGGAPACGAALAFNTDNGKVYDSAYGSCSGTQQFASINITGGPSRELIATDNTILNYNNYTTAMTYMGGGQFLIANYDYVYTIDQNGVMSNSFLFRDPEGNGIKGLVITTENIPFPQRPSVGTGAVLYTVEFSCCSPVLHQVSLSTGKTINSTPLSLSYGAEYFSAYSSGPTITDMARNPATGVVYVVGTTSSTFGGGNRYLGTLNVASGVVTPIGDTGYDVRDIAIDSAGNIYGVLGDWTGSTNGSIVKINPITGAATFYVNSGTATLPGNFTDRPPAMGYDSVTNALYLANGNNTKSLYKITLGASPVVTEILQDNNFGIGKTSSMADAIVPFWMPFLMGDNRLGEISRSGEYIIGPYLDHSARGMFVAGALAMQTATPSDTPTQTPVATPTFTITPTFTPMPAGIGAGFLYLGNTNDNIIYEFNTAANDYTGKSLQATLLGDVVLGFRAFAVEPGTGTLFASVATSSHGGPWALVSINMGTGVMTLKGNTGHYINALAFDGNGSLYGTAGGNEPFSNYGHTYSINKNTGVSTPLVSTSNSCGIGLAYNSLDGMLYNFTGCSLNSLESISITAATFGTVNGSVVSSIGEVRSALQLPGGNFLVGDGNNMGVYDSTGASLGLAISTSKFSKAVAFYASAIAGFGGSFLTPTPTPFPVPMAFLPQAGKLLIGVDAEGNGGWGGVAGRAYVIDPFNSSIIATVDFGNSVTYSAQVDGFMGLAYNSVDGKLYAAAWMNSDGLRHLVTLDMNLGVCTDIGAFGNEFIAGLACDPSGTLYAVQGNDSFADGKGAIYTVNTATGALTSFMQPTTKSGINGTSIAFDSQTGDLFRIAGDGSNNFGELKEIKIANKAGNSLSYSFQDNNVPNYILGLCPWSPGVLLLGSGYGELYTVDVKGQVIHRISLGSSYSFKGLALVPDTKAPTPSPTPTALVSIPAGKSLIVAIEGGANLHTLNLSTMTFTSDFYVSVAGHDIDMLTGVAKDPAANDLYVMAHYAEDNSQDRELLRINLATGAAQEVTKTSNYFVGLAFDSTGNSLFARAGNNGSNAGGIFIMDKTGGPAPTLLVAMPNGCCSSGNSLGFTYNDTADKFFTMSGSCAPSFDSSTTDGLTTANISTSGSNCTNGFGALGYIGGGMFLATDWQRIYYVDSSGVFNSGPMLPARIKSMALITGSMPAAVPTPQRTATPPAPTATPAYRVSGDDKSILGPVPATGKEPVCMYFKAAPVSSKWAVYNVAGDRVAELSFGSEGSQCWSHKDVAPGLYLVRMEVTTADGKETRTQKVVILP